jgi:hypothetical protein
MFASLPQHVIPGWQVLFNSQQQLVHLYGQAVSQLLH